MSFKDYAKAATNFDSALGLAETRKGYDPFQIENHYARFLLESRSETDLWDDYFSAWAKAHEIIRSQFKNLDEARYTFRVAAKYLGFIESRNSDLSKEEMEIFQNGCFELLDLAANIPEDHINRRYRADFETNIKAAIDYVTETI